MDEWTSVKVFTDSDVHIGPVVDLLTSSGLKLELKGETQTQAEALTEQADEEHIAQVTYSSVSPKKLSLRLRFTLSNLTNYKSVAVWGMMIHNLAAFDKFCQLCDESSYFIQLPFIRWLLN